MRGVNNGSGEDRVGFGAITQERVGWIAPDRGGNETQRILGKQELESE